MRIISNTRDYYDNIQAYGVDDHIIYDRPDGGNNPSAIEAPAILKPLIEKLGDARSDFSQGRGRSRQLGEPVMQLHFMLVGFCGALYPCIRIDHSSPSFMVDASDYCYSVEQCHKSVNGNALEKMPIDGGTSKFAACLEAFFRVTVPNPDDLFVALDTPVFLIADPYVQRYAHKEVSAGVSYSPNLQALGFQRAVDPYTAYQSLELYLGGVLCANKEQIPAIPDKYMIASKGFDDKSFRKEAGSKRRGRKKGRLLS